jgi:hypothetical protein
VIASRSRNDFRKKHERREKHRLLLVEVGVREERLHRRRRFEQPRVEDVDELLAARRDQVEAGFERFEVESHGAAPSVEMRHARKVAPRASRWNAASPCLVVRLPEHPESALGRFGQQDPD